VFAVTARIRAGLTMVQTLPAVTDLHLLAGSIGVAIWMKAAVHGGGPIFSGVNVILSVHQGIASIRSQEGRRFHSERSDWVYDLGD